jgi:thymidylate synthase
MKDGFPLLTTKKMAFKTMVTELLWFLRGDTNIKYLVDNNCHIWDGDAYQSYQRGFKEKHYLKPTSTKEEFINRIKTDDEFAKQWGELGPVYGKQWRKWKSSKNGITLYPNGSMGEPQKTSIISAIDQIANLISELKTNPDSRRLMVNAWNVGELDQMVLPPCHYSFQVYTREMSVQERQKYDKYFDDLIGEYPEHHITLDKRGVPRRAISLMYNCRSQDVPLGTPFNISSYALLLEIIAKQVNMVPDQLIGNLGDCHIYLNQIDGVKEQLTREPYPLPTVKILDKEVDDISHYEISDFELIGYQSNPTIKLPLSN